MRIIASRIACLLICLTGISMTIASADDDDEAPRKTSLPVAQTDTAPGVSLSQPSLQLAAIKTQKLVAVQQTSETVAYGTVIDLQGLLSLRQQYLAATAQQGGAQAKYREADQNLARTQNLHQQDIVSTRRLQEQQAQWQSDKANLNALNVQSHAILETSRMLWGETLTDWFVRSNDKTAAFLKQRAQLLQITLPIGLQLDDQTKDMVFDEQGRRDHGHKATLIGKAPQVDPVTQGARYFFKSEGRILPFGAPVTAWVASEDSTPRNGVVLPESAVVWHLGQACTFVKTAAGQFNRIVLASLTPVPGGYFVTDVLHADDEIVTSGAQTLLSQELKNQIPSEDND